MRVTISAERHHRLARSVQENFWFYKPPRWPEMALPERSKLHIPSHEIGVSQSAISQLKCMKTVMHIWWALPRPRMHPCTSRISCSSWASTGMRVIGTALRVSVWRSWNACVTRQMRVTWKVWFLLLWDVVLLHTIRGWVKEYWVHLAFHQTMGLAYMQCYGNCYGSRVVQ